MPTLVVHGRADPILPFEATAARLRDENLIADLTVVEVKNGPHDIGWTYPEETNAAIIEFLDGQAQTRHRAGRNQAPVGDDLNLAAGAWMAAR